MTNLLFFEVNFDKNVEKKDIAYRRTPVVVRVKERVLTDRTNELEYMFCFINLIVADFQSINIELKKCAIYRCILSC